MNKIIIFNKLKYLFLIILALSLYSQAQTLELKQSGNEVLWIIKDAPNSTELTRELINLDNRLREREELECLSGVNQSWFVEKLYRGKWLIRIYIKDKLIIQREFEIK